jgi:phage gp46-like protein
MNDLQTFEGDLLLVDTPDGGDIRIEDGLFVSDRAFDTSVYLSLFGGNKEDTGKVKNKNEWWGNLLPGTKESEKMKSRFQAFVTAQPMTTKTIAEAEDCAKLDLKWLVDERIADKIFIEGRAGNGNKFYLRVDVQASGKSIYENTYSLFWKVGIYGGV